MPLFIILGVIMAKIKNPTIKKNGVEFQLKEIPGLYATRFLSDFEKKHPQPTPPMRVVKYVGKVENLEPDPDNEYYKEQMATWNRNFSIAYTDFTIYMGVVNTPPVDWKPAYDFEYELTEKERKILWIGEYFVSESDLTELSEAIQSINNPTEKGLQEAEKNSD